MLRLLLLAGACSAAFGGGWAACSRWSAGGQVQTITRTVTAVEKQAAVSTEIAAGDAAAQTQIRYVTRTQLKEVPVYVTPATDRAYPLPVGLVRAHDAAALGVELSAVPDAAGRTDDQPSDVGASDLAARVVDNYGECRADQARLVALQTWLRGVTAAQK